MLKEIETLLIKKYRKFCNMPALKMSDEDNDKLDDLHSELELLGSHIAGLIESYIKTKKIKWTEKDLKNFVKVLKQKIDHINVKTIKNKILFKEYKKHSLQIIELISLMLRLLNQSAKSRGRNVITQFPRRFMGSIRRR